MDQGLKPDVVFCRILARLKPCRCYKAPKKCVRDEFFRSLFNRALTVNQVLQGCIPGLQSSAHLSVRRGSCVNIVTKVLSL
jgi:hypothetical protein